MNSRSFLGCGVHRHPYDPAAYVPDFAPRCDSCDRRYKAVVWITSGWGGGLLKLCAPCAADLRTALNGEDLATYPQQSEPRGEGDDA